MTDGIHLETAGSAGLITLDRPKTLNALNLDMIRAFRPVLAAWRADPAVSCVVIRGAGDRAFCAGGDVVSLRAVCLERGVTPEPPALAQDFFFEEYQLNHELHVFPKPYVALLDGVTMGGGVGLSVHGSHRVATERLKFAMPETTIGLFPDVGGGWFLPRLAGEVGTYLALTGVTIGAADCVDLGIATHYVTSDRLPDLEAALAAVPAANSAANPAGGDLSASVDAAIAPFASAPGDAPSLAAARGMIDHCFAFDTVEEIVAALTADGGEFAIKTRDAMLSKSPTALKVSLEQIRRGRDMKTMAEVMTMEYRLSQWFVVKSDFFEGIRALLVDKDKSPRWNPPTLDGVSADEVASYFDPVAWRELRFD